MYTGNCSVQFACVYLSVCIVYLFYKRSWSLERGGKLIFKKKFKSRSLVHVCVCVCAHTHVCFGMIPYPQQSVWPTLWSELLSMINGSASVLGHQGNPKPDSPQEFATSPSKLGCVCVCVCAVGLWVRDGVRLNMTLWKDGVGCGKGGRREVRFSR